MALDAAHFVELHGRCRGEAGGRLELFGSRADERRLLEKVMRARVPVDGRPLVILEAGCGRRWPLNLSGVSHVLVGLDEDAVALRARMEQGDLNTAINCSLYSVQFEPERFDVIYCSFVLEHLEDAEGVLDRFCRWLKPGGCMVLRFPDRNSVYGRVAQSTPFWMHLLHKRFVLGKEAGKPGQGPYPTFYTEVVSIKGMRTYCQSRGLQIQFEFGHPFYLKRRGILAALNNIFVLLVSRLSGNRLQWRYNNLTYIIVKPAKESDPALSRTGSQVQCGS